MVVATSTRLFLFSSAECNVVLGPIAYRTDHDMAAGVVTAHQQLPHHASREHVTSSKCSLFSATFASVKFSCFIASHFLYVADAMDMVRMFLLVILCASNGERRPMIFNA